MTDMEDAVQLYKNGMPLLQVWRATGVGRNKLYNTLKDLGLMRSNKENSRKYDVNHDFFRSIDSEEKAYWLGFIYADGYVTCSKTGQKNVGVTLGRKDRAHLESLREALQASYEIKDYEGNSYGKVIEYSRLLITSDQLYDDLQSKGVLTKKSLILTFPKEDVVPAELTHHFIRGYFDGDGSFSYSGKRDNTYAVKIQGTAEFLRHLMIHIEKDLVNLSKRWDDDKNSYSLEFMAKNDVIAFGKYIYNNATIYMDRKYKRYEALHSPSPQ